ncbi:MAG: metal-sensitive transcriptional regulator [Senegalia sp. (in: firmicutes)]|uniref:metal-sensitive transcriptional regulator n=1 Tax=Senegalia sp. (in: firmicutes) TaxID=1924098 RepID=UPI003F96743D
MEDITTKKSSITRLRKIEGQIKGIQKMIEEDKYCEDILVQITAAKSALNKVGGIILENYTKNCIKRDSSDEKDSEESIQKLINIIMKYNN